jgi:hypothetical protein
MALRGEMIDFVGPDPIQNLIQVRALCEITVVVVLGRLSNSRFAAGSDPVNLIIFAFQKPGEIISILAIDSSDQGNSTHDMIPQLKRCDFI